MISHKLLGFCTFVSASDERDVTHEASADSFLCGTAPTLSLLDRKVKAAVALASAPACQTTMSVGVAATLRRLVLALCYTTLCTCQARQLHAPLDTAAGESHSACFSETVMSTCK